MRSYIFYNKSERKWYNTIMLGGARVKYLKLLGWLGLYVVIYLISSVIGGIFLGFAYLISSLLSGALLPLEIYIAENMTLLLIISGLLTLLFSFLILLARGYNPFKYLEFRIMSARDTIIMVLMGIGFSFFVNSLLTLIRIDEIFTDHVTEELVRMMTANVPLAFLAIGIIVPVYEEVLIRGLVFKELNRNMNLWVAILLQGLIFGLIHGNLLQFSYTFPMGIILGYIYLKYRSIWAPILIHLVWNCTSLLMGLVMPETSPLVFLLFLFFGGALFIGGMIYTVKFMPPLHIYTDCAT